MTETITVRPGQIWADNDKRQHGRTLRVERVDGDRTLCRILTNRDVVQRDIDRYGAAGMQDRRGKTVSVATAGGAVPAGGPPASTKRDATRRSPRPSMRRSIPASRSAGSHVYMTESPNGELHEVRYDDEKPSD